MYIMVHLAFIFNDLYKVFLKFKHTSSWFNISHPSKINPNQSWCERERNITLLKYVLYIYLEKVEIS